MSLHFGLLLLKASKTWLGGRTLHIVLPIIRAIVRLGVGIQEGILRDPIATSVRSR